MRNRNSWAVSSMANPENVQGLKFCGLKVAIYWEHPFLAKAIVNSDVWPPCSEKDKLVLEFDFFAIP